MNFTDWKSVNIVMSDRVQYHSRNNGYQKNIVKKYELLLNKKYEKVKEKISKDGESKKNKE